MSNPLYTKSIGVTWETIPVPKEYAGNKLILKYHLLYNEKNCGFDNISLFNEKAFILHIISDKIPALVLCIVYMTIGFLLIVTSIFINSKIKTSYELLYLGLIAITAASYCLVETQIFQIFIDNKNIIHLLSIFSMILIPGPIILYTNENYEFKQKKIPSVFMFFSLAIFVILTSMNYFKIADYHELMLAINALIALAVVFMIGRMISYLWQNKNQTKDYNSLIIIGLSSIAIAGLIDILRFYNSYTQDPALFTRFGFLVFIICLTISNAKRIIESIAGNAKIKVISKLAYEDGLTGLYNRTSYKEKLKELSDLSELVEMNL